MNLLFIGLEPQSFFETVLLIVGFFVVLTIAMLPLVYVVVKVIDRSDAMVEKDVKGKDVKAKNISH